MKLVFLLGHTNKKIRQIDEISQRKRVRRFHEIFSAIHNCLLAGKKGTESKKGEGSFFMNLFT